MSRPGPDLGSPSGDRPSPAPIVVPGWGQRFERLNLSRNPFGAPAPEDWLELFEGSLRELSAWLGEPGRALLLLGEQGRGKTTHLRALGGVLPQSSYVYLPEEGEHPTIPESDCLLLDEAQRLTAGRRRRLFFSVRSIAVASHRDHSSELRAAGLELRCTRLDTSPTQRYLRRLLARRLEWARLSEGPLPWFEEDQVAELIARFGSDLRSLEGHLYDLFQRLDRVRAVRV